MGQNTYEGSDDQWFHAYYDAYTTTRCLEGVSRVSVCPELNQDLLLAGFGALRACGYDKGFPGHDVVLDWLRRVIIEVDSGGYQDTHLGVFFTNPYAALFGDKYPTKAREKGICCGIFPVRTRDVKYHIRPPRVDGRLIDRWWDPVVAGDPTMIQGRHERGEVAPKVLLYKSDPFSFPASYVYNPRRIPNDVDWSSALEVNSVDYFLRFIRDYHRLPYYLTRREIQSFLNSHCSNPRYVELHAALTQGVEKGWWSSQRPSRV